MCGGGGRGRFFRNFRGVVMYRWDTGTPSLCFWFRCILLLLETKLNFPNTSLSKSCSLISISIPRLSCLNTIPIKRHIIYPIWQYPTPLPPTRRGQVAHSVLLSQILKNLQKKYTYIYKHVAVIKKYIFPFSMINYSLLVILCFRLHDYLCWLSPSLVQ